MTDECVGLPRWFDITVAALVLGMGSPLWLLIALVVSLTSKGPCLYRATRIGKNGEPFQLLKFRTMRIAVDGPRITARSDDRITGVGRLLRTSKLDEIPQFINVFRGEMAIVGPRPEDPRYVACYDDEQRRLLAVLPGLTGAASVVYRHEEQLLGLADDADAAYVAEILPRKTAIDLAWLASRTWRDDARILWQTARALITSADEISCVRNPSEESSKRPTLDKAIRPRPQRGQRPRNGSKSL